MNIIKNCIRNGKFGLFETHVCFYCGNIFLPGKAQTCEICNWKKCSKGHCGCSTSKETKEILTKFYDLFCENNNYSNETIFALNIMLKCYMVNCNDKR